MTFKAIQTYSNGDVVRWIDVQQPGQPEPDHPAPVLTLTTGTADTGGGSQSGSARPGAEPGPSRKGAAGRRGPSQR